MSKTHMTGYVHVVEHCLKCGEEMKSLGNYNIPLSSNSYKTVFKEGCDKGCTYKEWYSIITTSHDLREGFMQFGNGDGRIGYIDVNGGLEVK